MTSISPFSFADLHTYDGGNYQAMQGIATIPDGTIIYICMNGISGIGIIKSINSGLTWSIVNTNTSSFTSIACSSDGSIVYAANLGNGLFKSTNSGATWFQVTFTGGDALPGGASNPESSAGGQFPGYQLSNIYKLACDSTGSKLIMTTNAAASIYRSTDGGLSWSFSYAAPGYATNPNAPTTLASNSSGTVLYAALNTNATKNIIVSKNSGATWATIPMLGASGPFGTLATNSYGDFVFGVDGLSNLNIFYPTHTDSALLVPGFGNTLVSIASYDSGNKIIISQNSFNTVINGAVVLYSIVNKYPPGNDGDGQICFKEDTKVLCFKDGKETYIKVQDIRKGDLVKTLNNGYVPVNIIGTSILYNSGDDLREKDKLYVCSPCNYPSLTEDLVITGRHSILEDTLTTKQKEETLEVLEAGKLSDDLVTGVLDVLMTTDTKFRLMAFLDERATPFLEKGEFAIWHLALDNTNDSTNYGIYANGLLVESCSKRCLKELSNMTLV